MCNLCPVVTARASDRNAARSVYTRTIHEHDVLHTYTRIYIILYAHIALWWFCDGPEYRDNKNSEREGDERILQVARTVEHVMKTTK